MNVSKDQFMWPRVLSDPVCQKRDYIAKADKDKIFGPGCKAVKIEISLRENYNSSTKLNTNHKTNTIFSKFSHVKPLRRKNGSHLS